MSIFSKRQAAKIERAEALELSKQQVARKVALLSKDKSFPGESRGLTRDQYFRIAEITLPNGEKIQCDVLDETKVGLKLELDSDANLPERFALLVPSREIDQSVGLIWKDGPVFGITLELPASQN